METIKPTKRQLEFMDWEFGVFFHFGIRTYYQNHSDWDGKPMDISVFNPQRLDCDQWLQAAKAAGARYAVFTAKHHDGFANRNSAYTDYSIKNTPYKNGGGDIVKSFTDACRKFGLKVGIYYSPAQFGSRQSENYDDYFINQISELLTGYGKIDYLWFDGCGSEGHNYDTKRIIKEIRTLQPNILIFNMWDPDTRRVGNEDGYAPECNLNVTDSLDFSVMTDKKKNLKNRRFLPAECDCRIRDNWFYHEDDNLKSLDKLMDIYENSVGHGANLLLNLSPAPDGLIPDEDVKRMEGLGERIHKEFCSADFEFSSTEYECNAKISRAVICEDLTEGQRVKEFALYADGKLIFGGSTIGHKRICRFGPVYAKKIEIKTDVCANLNTSLYK
ncbi:MAG: alpha-L-fucosidase [Clostridiales bacterium]|nr:alpha-L-fucosidase [Clostridiales bacterium]